MPSYPFSLDDLELAVAVVADALDTARRQAKDTRSRLIAVAKANEHTAAGATATVSELEGVEAAMPMSAETREEFSWIVAGSTDAESGEATTQVQGAVTEVRQAAERLAGIAALAKGAYEDSALRVDGLCLWLKSSKHVINRAVATSNGEHEWDAVEREIGLVRGFAPALYRSAIAKRTSAGAAVKHDSSLRVACAQVEQAFDRAIDVARAVRRTWEDIQRS